MLDKMKIRPQPGWALCETLVPVNTTASGLVLARDLETGKTTECAARVLRITPGRDDSGRPVDPGARPGDVVVIRDFLKFANAVGNLVGADRDDRVFLLNIRDIFAVVSGEGTLGFYGEYEVRESG